MDVDREIAAANRRVQRQIDASAREALIRLGFDPDKEALAAQAEAWSAAVAGFVQLMFHLGEAAAAILTAFAEAAHALGEGES
ncbi:hypothetical protein [Microbacterium sp. PF5]|uniref:hypothetical protein n=1 Tax=Microbacterium sp. PF5 TaxID=2305435 RepID=UPI00109BC953|nr:hypothetical protein [Microbacterium sp. PF5]